MNSIFLKTLRREKTSQIPVWFMRQAGRYLPEYRELRAKKKGFLDLCYSPQDASRVTLQPIERFGFDAAILFSDILVVPHAVGVDVKFTEGEGPSLQPVNNEAELAKLDLSKITKFLSPVYETANIVAGKLDDKPLIGFAGAPWTVACYMTEGKASREFQKAREIAAKQPQFFARLIEFLQDATFIHLENQILAGAKALQIFDSWAGVLPENDFRKWVIEPAKNIVARIKNKYPDVPVIGFPRGAGALYADYAATTGVDAVSCDSQVPLSWAKRELSGKVLQGNLDNVLLASDKEGAIAQTRKIIEHWRDMPMIFNLGHGILPHTPIENVEAVLKTIRV